jgi:hypothetical protein
MEFSIEKNIEPRNGNPKRIENDDDSIDEVIPSNGVTNTLACASE